MSSYKGTVKWFNNAKGYGFLGREDGGADVFAHFTSIRKSGYKTLKEGELVSFDIVQGEKGPQADNVTPLHGQHAHVSAAVAAPPPLAESDHA